MTDSDIPGPGRTLGKVYVALGCRLELFLNRLAERRRLGPAGVAFRIRDRLTTALKRGGRGGGQIKSGSVLRYTEGEKAEQRKDMKKLLNYVK